MASIWRDNMLGYLSEGNTCTEKRTVNFEKQVMSKDKYTSICSRQMEAIVFIILQILQKRPINFGNLF